MTEPKPPLVLIVDDDPAHCLMLITLLEDWDYRTSHAHDGQKVVEYVRSHPVDLILMDVRMPVMDGIKAARQVKHKPLNQQVPVVIMTAYSAIASATEASKQERPTT